MKKVIFLGLVAIGFSMTSCKKDYTCTYDLLGVEQVQEYNDLDKDAKSAAETQCSLLGGTFAEK